MLPQKKNPSQPDTQPLIEIVDSANRPLGALPLQDVQRQALLHRIVLVCIYNRKNNLYLRKRNYDKDIFPGRWNISLETHIRAGEGSRDAAKRKALDSVPMCPEKMRFLHTIPPSIETGNAFIELFRLDGFDPPSPAQEDRDLSMFVDKDELAGLIRYCPELVTPFLVYFWKQGMIF